MLLYRSNKNSIAELDNISKKVYPNVSAVMNIRLLKKIHVLLAEEFLDNLIVKLRFGNIDQTAWKVVGQFRRALSLNEAHSYA